MDREIRQGLRYMLASNFESISDEMLEELIVRGLDKLLVKRNSNGTPTRGVFGGVRRATELFCQARGLTPPKVSQVGSYRSDGLLKIRMEVSSISDKPTEQINWERGCYRYNLPYDLFGKFISFERRGKVFIWRIVGLNTRATRFQILVRDMKTFRDYKTSATHLRALIAEGKILEA